MWASSWWMLFCWRVASDTHSMVARCQTFCQVLAIPMPQMLQSPQNGAWQQEACKGFISLFMQKKLFLALRNKLFILLSSDLAWFLCRSWPVSCSNSGSCFSRRAYMSPQGEVIRHYSIMMLRLIHRQHNINDSGSGSLMWSGLLMVLLRHRGNRLFWPNEHQLHTRKCCKRENLVCTSVRLLLHIWKAYCRNEMRA